MRSSCFPDASGRFFLEYDELAQVGQEQVTATVTEFEAMIGGFDTHQVHLASQGSRQPKKDSASTVLDAKKDGASKVGFQRTSELKSKERLSKAK